MKKPASGEAGGESGRLVYIRPQVKVLDAKSSVSRQVTPLDDNKGTNIWVASTADGKLRRIADFGQRRTFIARRISWSADGKWVFAAVGEGDADIVQMDGLLLK